MSVPTTLTLLLWGSAFWLGIEAGYAPIHTTCPDIPLVRPASGLSSAESAYRQQRKQIADQNLAAWLTKTDSGFQTNGSLPTLALTTSGGGYRSALVGAGVIQGLDARDSDISTSGLYQALTYQSGLSGGAWLLSSIAGNNYPTISYLKETLWEQAFQDSLLVPGNLLVAEAYGKIVADITAKGAAGFPPTLTDPWGRLLSYQFLQGPDGGVDTTLSSVSGLSNFTSHAVPYPVILTLGVKTWDGQCLPGPNATIWEFSPYEFGSWDSDVSAFTPTHYLGTSLSGGQPTVQGSCVINYDNLGYVLGSSSNLFNEACSSVPTATNSTTSLTEDLAEMVAQVHQLSTSDEYAVLPNPFYEYNSSTAVANPANPVWEQPTLHLVDGGEALQNNPIWPFLQPARAVDVMIVNDNSADTSNNFPNGSEILTTYVQSQSAGLTRMPYIPSVETFLSQGLNRRPTVFGCNTTAITIVYLPNVNITYPSNTSTEQVQYSVPETEGMISNGVAMAEQPGEIDWPLCLACVIMMKTNTTLPASCAPCWAKYCYYQ
ncbi:hypothetical protein CDV55_104077 [Aspergillus turcosus]|uniref:Lysophospholipase n=1 Tax=Aspergillus turcosus TaxID=1245748 RepID=A0A229WWV4_9EURO|nr:hypothetical protein CDV55_104077 [Aspergillus turcosus]RLL97674.1 hypothetical protein CFD26_106879 [Aspergillus turcosus]